MQDRAFRIGLFPPILMLIALAASVLIASVYAAVAEPDASNPIAAIWYEYDGVQASVMALPAAVACAAALLFPGRATPVPTQVLMKYARNSAHLAAMWGTLAAIGLVWLVIAKGDFLLSAPAYLSFAVPRQLISFTNLFAPITLVSSGIVMARWRTFGFILALATGLVLVGYGTRLLALAPLLVLIGYMLGGRRVRTGGWLAAGILSFALLPLPLIARQASEHGLIPYISAIFHNYDISTAITEIVGNIGFSMPILEYTARTASIPTNYMWISVSPVDTESWERIAPQMRAHYFIPYSALGEWASFGAIPLFFATLIWAVATRVALSEFAKLHHGLSFLFLVSGSGLVALSLVYALQYNTRSVARILWVLLAMTVVSKVIALIRRSNAKPFGTPAGSERGRVSRRRRPEHAQRVTQRLRAGSAQ